MWSCSSVLSLRPALLFPGPAHQVAEVANQADGQVEVEAVVQQMSLGLHADQFAAARPHLLPSVRVLEPHHVRDERGVPQEEQFRDLPRDHFREQGREHPVRDREPEGREQEPDQGSAEHLPDRVVLQVDAAKAHHHRHRYGRGYYEELRHVLHYRVIVHVMQSKTGSFGAFIENAWRN